MQQEACLYHTEEKDKLRKKQRIIYRKEREREERVLVVVGG